MASLKQEKCEVCRVGAPQVTEEEINEFRQQVPEWTIIERDNIKRLERVFKFKDFVSALDFANKIGAAAEEEGHHPAILVEWGRVGIAWWTHKIKGLHRNDFVMAAKSDEIYSSL